MLIGSEDAIYVDLNNLKLFCGSDGETWKFGDIKIDFAKQITQFDCFENMKREIHSTLLHFSEEKEKTKLDLSSKSDYSFKNEEEEEDENDFSFKTPTKSFGSPEKDLFSPIPVLEKRTISVEAHEWDEMKQFMADAKKAQKEKKKEEEAMKKQKEEEENAKKKQKDEEAKFGLMKTMLSTIFFAWKKLFTQINTFDETIAELEKQFSEKVENKRLDQFEKGSVAALFGMDGTIDYSVKKLFAFFKEKSYNPFYCYFPHGINKVHSNKKIERKIINDTWKTEIKNFLTAYGKETDDSSLSSCFEKLRDSWESLEKDFGKKVYF